MAYAGAKQAYGILGMQRMNWQNVLRQTRGFSTTHSVYSFFLLNVKETLARGLLYPAKKVWEDIEFLHMVDESDLVICKFNKYIHDKRYDRPPMPLPPPPPTPPLQLLEVLLGSLDDKYFVHILDSMPRAHLPAYNWVDAFNLCSTATSLDEASHILLPLKVIAQKVIAPLGEKWDSSVLPLLGFTPDMLQPLQTNDSLVARNYPTIDREALVSSQLIRRDIIFVELLNNRERIKPEHLLISEYLYSLVYFKLVRVNTEWYKAGQTMLIDFEQSRHRLLDSNRQNNNIAERFKRLLMSASVKEGKYDVTQASEYLYCRLQKQAIEELSEEGHASAEEHAALHYILEEKLRGEESAATSISIEW